MVRNYNDRLQFCIISNAILKISFYANIDGFEGYQSESRSYTNPGMFQVQSKSDDFN